MAVIKESIQNELTTLLTSLEGESPEKSKEKLASGLADIIKNAILSANVNVGIAVSAPPPSGIGVTTSLGTLL